VVRLSSLVFGEDWQKSVETMGDYEERGMMRRAGSNKLNLRLWPTALVEIVQL